MKRWLACSAEDMIHPKSSIIVIAVITIITTGRWAAECNNMRNRVYAASRMIPSPKRQRLGVYSVCGIKLDLLNIQFNGFHLNRYITTNLQTAQWQAGTSGLM
jgi:hypothetical protein